jgi:hypothetical protein
LSDWTQLVENFKVTASQVKTTHLLIHSNETHIMLLKWLAHFHDQKSASKVMSNLLGVAMHLSRLRSRASAVRETGGPPTSILIGSVPVEKVSASSIELNQKELEYVEKFHAVDPREGPKDIAPLMLALFVSPLYLLIPSVLLKKTFGKRILLEVSTYIQ